MNTSRLEAFSDAVIAVIITIMVLELKVPHGSNLSALQPLIPTFLVYMLSFSVVGTYWNNHHHLIRATRELNSRIMWSNLHLLFWLSLVPLFTAWLGQNYQHAWPTAVYAILLLLCGGAYQILQSAIFAGQPKNSALRTSLGKDIKGKLSLVLYTSAVILAFVNHWAADAFLATVAIMWFIPDQRLKLEK